MSDAFLCGPRGRDPEDTRLGRVRPEQLTDDDRAAIDGFAHFLQGGSVCLICMTPDDQCPAVRTRGVRADACCPDCKHGAMKPPPKDEPTTEGAPTV